jgi:hypothetical protein
MDASCVFFVWPAMTNDPLACVAESAFVAREGFCHHFERRFLIFHHHVTDSGQGMPGQDFESVSSNYLDKVCAAGLRTGKDCH